MAFSDPNDAARAAIHRRSVEAFAGHAELADPAIERVEVPYEGSSFPAWFVPAANAAAKSRTPAVFYLPGWDSTKEQGIELALALAERGMAVLLCDGPGIGEAVTFRGMVN